MAIHGRGSAEADDLTLDKHPGSFHG